MAPAGAGTPVKKFPAQAGLLGSAVITLKRARRSPVQIANTMAKIHPRLPSSCRLQKYNISACGTGSAAGAGASAEDVRIRKARRACRQYSGLFAAATWRARLTVIH